MFKNKQQDTLVQKSGEKKTQKKGPPLKKSTDLENIHSLSLKKGLSGLVRQELDQSEASYRMQVGRGDEA